MAEVTNTDRAGWAQVAVDAFQDETKTDDECVLQDILTDLRHWSDSMGYDWDITLGNAMGMYETEKKEDKP